MHRIVPKNSRVPVGNVPGDDDFSIGLGSTPELRELASKELADIAELEHFVALGDAWWEFAGNVSPLYRAEHRRHTAYLYRIALPDLSGFTRVRVEDRHADYSEAESPATEAPGGADEPKAESKDTKPEPAPKEQPRSAFARVQADKGTFVKLEVNARLFDDRQYFWAQIPESLEEAYLLCNPGAQHAVTRPSAQPRNWYAETAIHTHFPHADYNAAEPTISRHWPLCMGAGAGLHGWDVLALVTSKKRGDGPLIRENWSKRPFQLLGIEIRLTPRFCRFQPAAKDRAKATRTLARSNRDSKFLARLLFPSDCLFLRWPVVIRNAEAKAASMRRVEFVAVATALHTSQFVLAEFTHILRFLDDSLLPSTVVWYRLFHLSGSFRKRLLQ